MRWPPAPLPAGRRAGFEYPIEHLPDSVRSGALRPPIPSDWVPPRWWRDLDGSWPVVHVTQGTIRPDPTELLLPTMEALADEDVLVVATTGGWIPASSDRCRRTRRAESFIPYELLLARASAFVTNGGFIGTNLALHHGVPVIQVRRTEEKAEIGARIEHAGVGLRFDGRQHDGCATPCTRAHRPTVRGQRRPPQRAVPAARRRPRRPRCSSSWLSPARS